jgi:hypothetical protein
MHIPEKHTGLHKGTYNVNFKQYPTIQKEGKKKTEEKLDGRYNEGHEQKKLNL